MDARAARDAMDAMQNFARWCIQSAAWWWGSWDVGYMAITFLGAEGNYPTVEAWARPAYNAFCCGAWILYWTETTLYWVAKPAVRVERIDIFGQRRLHCEDGPALNSDAEDLYFWHGVLVPGNVVMNPETITTQQIVDEGNAEVRRVMVERMGWERFCSETRMETLHADELQTNFPAIPVSELVAPGQRLVTSYRAGLEHAELLESALMRDFADRPLRFVRLTDPSTGRQYCLRVQHTHTRCYAGVGWTFGMTEAQYKGGVYLRQGDVMLLPINRQPGLREQAHS